LGLPFKLFGTCPSSWSINSSTPECHLEAAVEEHHCLQKLFALCAKPFLSVRFVRSWNFFFWN
jgi:hypothetical protein